MRRNRIVLWVEPSPPMSGHWRGLKTPKSGVDTRKTFRGSVETMGVHILWYEVVGDYKSGTRCYEVVG